MRQAEARHTAARRLQNSRAAHGKEDRTGLLLKGPPTHPYKQDAQRMCQRGSQDALWPACITQVRTRHLCWTTKPAPAQVHADSHSNTLARATAGCRSDGLRRFLRHR